MKTLTFICALKVISNNFNVKKQKRKKDGSEKTEVNVCPHCLLSLLNSWWGKKIKFKKKCTRLAFGALGTNRRYRCIRPPPPTVYAPQHVQTVHYSLLLTGCSWGEGAGSWSSQEVFTSQCTQSSCQLASPAFIRWNSENIPLRWGMLGGGYGAASNNRYQKPPAWNCPSATGRVSPLRRDQWETASVWIQCI